jgi:nitroreductase
MENTTHYFDINPVLSKRFSPRAFSHTDTLSADQIGPLFEAARWSPSWGNSQPWSFVVGFRGDDVFHKILGTFSPGNAIWAQHVSALVANITRLETADGTELTHAVYDLGQSVAHLCAQATSEGILVHQMSGFDADELAKILSLEPVQRVITVMALGTQGDPADLPERLRERESLPRTRKPLSEIVSGSVVYP